MGQVSPTDQASNLIASGHSDLALKLLVGVPLQELNEEWRRKLLLLFFRLRGVPALRQELERQSEEGFLTATTVYLTVKLIASVGQVFVKDPSGKDGIDWLRIARRLDSRHIPVQTSLAFLLSQTATKQNLDEAAEICFDLGKTLAERGFDQNLHYDDIKTLSRAYRNIGDPRKSVECSIISLNKRPLSDSGRLFISNLERLKGLPSLLVSEEERSEALFNYSSTIEILLNEKLPSKLEREPLLESLLEISNFHIPYLSVDDINFSKKYCELITRLGVFFSFQCEFKSPLRHEKSLAVLGTFKQHTPTFVNRFLSTLIDQSDWKIDFINIGDGHSFPNLPPTSDRVRRMNFPINVKTYDSFVKIIRGAGYSHVFFSEVGMSAESRFLSFHRLAPVQFTSWLHPVSTGSDHVDLFFSGAAMEPENASEHYSEKLILLSGIGQNFLEPSEITFTKKSSPGTGRIICLQSAFKIQPYFDDWIREILQIEGVKEMVFLNPNAPIQRKLFQQRFEKLNNNKKITFLDRVNYEEFLGLLQNCEMALDVPNWSGGNTTIDCLKTGLPVVGYRGDRMRSRHTFGIYKLMGLENLLSVGSRADYLSLIRQLLDSEFNNYCRDAISASLAKLAAAGDRNPMEFFEALQHPCSHQ